MKFLEATFEGFEVRLTLVALCRQKEIENLLRKAIADEAIASLQDASQSSGRTPFSQRHVELA